MLHFDYASNFNKVVPELDAISTNLKTLYANNSLSLSVGNSYVQTCTIDLRETLQHFPISEIAGLKNTEIPAGENFMETVEILKYELGILSDHVAGQALRALDKKFRIIQNKYINAVDGHNLFTYPPLEESDLSELRQIAQILNYEDHEIQWGGLSNQIARACTLMDVASFLEKFPDTGVKLNYKDKKVTMQKGAVTIE